MKSTHRFKELATALIYIYCSAESSCRALHMYHARYKCMICINILIKVPLNINIFLIKVPLISSIKLLTSTFDYGILQLTQIGAISAYKKHLLLNEK